MRAPTFGASRGACSPPATLAACGANLLVYANKQDKANVMDAKEIVNELGLRELKDRKWHVQTSVIFEGAGMYEGLDWLAAAVARK